MEIFKYSLVLVVSGLVVSNNYDFQCLQLPGEPMDADEKVGK